ncbi:oligosaccharide flippase family protein [Oenococcus kitaharae]|uniref:lipopolysaccharide biosynthesis protein n=1 Tax=Oenococcus TaxID=46254 RepID=UPI0021E8F1F8|nr:oligosaccharide flippase family protein [Oenococcus kitaharae]MCV3296569.1 oligosaccharide flippase family protein [Oenococcus kitaharae]
MIFAIGNLGSKLVNFLLVPLYTYALSTRQFGLVDLITATVSVAAPIISLSISDAVFRFAMDKFENKSRIFTNSLFFAIVTGALSFLALPLLLWIHVPFGVFLLTITFLTNIFSILQNFVRAVGRVKVFALAGIVGTIVLGASNILLLMIFHLGVDGYLWSILFSILFSIFFVVFASHIWCYIKISALSLRDITRFLKYSIPLIPNGLSWWLTNDASRFFILFFVGVSGNGLFAVANKIPTILNVLFSIFAQAWQISAIDEFANKNSEKFYSKVFDLLISFSFILVAVFTLLIHPFMFLYVSPKFYSAWQFVPMLLLAATYSNFSSFLGTAYLAAKKTSGILITTMSGMAVNLLVSLTLIPQIGVHGAGIGGALGFLVASLIRLYQTRSFIKITVNWQNAIFSQLLVLSMIFISLFKFDFHYTINIFLFISLIVVNRRNLTDVFAKIIPLILRK